MLVMGVGFIALGYGEIKGPDEVSGLELWLDSEYGVIEHGGKLSQWTSKEGSEHAQQTSEQRQPTFLSDGTPTGLPAIQFEADKEDVKASDFLQLSGVLLGVNREFTAFVVVSLQDLEEQQVIFDNKNGTSDASGFYLHYKVWNGARILQLRGIDDNETAKAYFEVNLDIEELLTNDPHAFFVIGMRMDPERRRSLQAGSLLIESASGEPIKNIAGKYPLYIGSTRGDNFHFTGKIASMVFYNRALSNPEMDAVTEYLHTRFIGDSSAE